MLPAVLKLCFLALGVTSFRLGNLVALRSPVVSASRLLSSNSDYYIGDSDEEELPDNLGMNGFVLYRGKRGGGLKKRDNRDQLPFRVYVSKENTLGDTDRVLGSFQLDASTAVGDVLDLGSLGTFTVTKVHFLYRYVQNNRLKVTSKKLEVLPLSISPLQVLQ